MIPSAARVGVLYQSVQGEPFLGHTMQLDVMKGPADSLRMKLIPFVITESATTIDSAFMQMRRDGLDGAIVLSSALFHGHKHRIIIAAARERMPTVYEHRDFTEAGGLVSYGPDFRQLFRRLAYFVDRIAKGASPADLPIERASKFELVVNLKAATDLGITLPYSILTRADEVIE